MSTEVGCEMTWMVEAREDGRLSDQQRDTFARHVDSCDRCARGAKAVSNLRQRLATLPEPPLSDVHHRRQRQQLLAQAGEAQASPVTPSFNKRRLVLAAALVILGAGVTARQVQVRWTAASLVPTYEVTALAGARWTNEEYDRTARVVLSQGSAAFHVHHLGPGQRFLVMLPDGEIEVRGTRFVVNVENDHTRYVVVIDGKVALRQTGTMEKLLLGGERWDSSFEPPPMAAPPVDAERKPRVDAVNHQNPAKVSRRHRSRIASTGAPIPDYTLPLKPKDHDVRGGRGSARVTSTGAVASAPTATVPAATTTAPEVPLPTAGDLFAEGIHAFRANRYDQADELWRTFLRQHPHDPRAEDAAFLRAVGRFRAGDVRGATTLARTYLQEFPRGLRRTEAEALLRSAPQSTENP